MRRRGFSRAAWLALAVAVAGAGSGEARRRQVALDDAEIEAALNPEIPLDRAILQAREVVAKEPANPEALIWLGNRYLERALLSEAQDAFQRALDLDPEYAVGWNNLGVANELAGDRGRAESHFRRALGIDSLNAEAHYNLAALLEHKGDFDGAVRSYKAALRLDPTLGDVKRNPRASNAELLLPVRLALYLESWGGKVLTPEGPRGESLLRVPPLSRDVPTPSPVPRGRPAPAPAGPPRLTAPPAEPSPTDAPRAPTTGAEATPTPEPPPPAGAAPPRPAPRATPPPPVRRDGALPANP